MGIQCSCIENQNVSAPKPAGGSDSGRIQTLHVDIANKSIIEDSLTSEDSSGCFAESNGLFSPSNALPKARLYFPRFKSFESDPKSDGEESDDTWKKTVSFSQYISHEQKPHSARKEYTNPKHGEVWGAHNIMLKHLIHNTENEYLWEGENNELKTKCSVRYIFFDTSQLFPDDISRIEANIRQISSIECPNIAQVYSFGIYEQIISKKTYYIVVITQELGACTMKDVYDAKLSKGERWSELEILHVLHGILDALIMCTHFGITNQKLAIENIVFSEETHQVMLTDFDIYVPTGTPISNAKSMSVIHRKSIFGKLKAGSESSRIIEPPSLNEDDKKSLLNLLFKLLGPEDSKASIDTLQDTDKFSQGYNHLFGLLQLVSAKQPFSVINEYFLKHLESFEAKNSFNITKNPLAKMNQSQTLELLNWKFDCYFWVGNFSFAQGVYLTLANLFSDATKGQFLSREYQQYMKLGNRMLKQLVETRDFIKARDLAHELNTQFKKDQEFKKVLRNVPIEYISFTFLVGNIYDGMKEIDKAIRHYSKGMEHCAQKKIKTDNYQSVLKRIATLLLEKNQEAEALGYFKKLTLLNPGSDKADIETADVYLIMGEILKAQGNAKQAIKFYLQAWEVMRNEKSREDFNLKRIEIASRISDSYVSMNEEQFALRFEAESQNLRKKVYGRDSPEYKKSLRKLADMQMKLKHYEAALEGYQAYYQLLKKSSDAYPKEHEESLVCLAEAYFISRNYKEALELYNQYALIVQKTDGVKSKKYLRVQDSIAKNQFKSGVYKSSLDIQLTNLQTKRQLYEKNDTVVVIALNNIGNTYYALGRFEDALVYHMKSLETLETQPIDKRSKGREQILLSIALDYRKLENSSKGLEYIYQSFSSGEQTQETLANPETALEFYDTIGEQHITGITFEEITRET